MNSSFTFEVGGEPPSSQPAWDLGGASLAVCCCQQRSLQCMTDRPPSPCCSRYACGEPGYNGMGKATTSYRHAHADTALVPLLHAGSICLWCLGTDTALRVPADVTQQAHDDLLADGRGGGTTVDAKIQRRLASTAAINQRMAALKRKRAQQAGPERDDSEDDDQPSDEEAEDDSDDEDAPLPGELESEDGERLPSIPCHCKTCTHDRSRSPASCAGHCRREPHLPFACILQPFACREHEGAACYSSTHDAKLCPCASA